MSVFADSGFDKDSRTCSKGVSPGLGTTKHQICCMLFIISLSCGHTNLQSNNTVKQNTVSFSFNIWWEEGVVVDGRIYCLSNMVCNNYLSTLRFTSVVVTVKSSSRLANQKLVAFVKCPCTWPISWPFQKDGVLAALWPRCPSSALLSRNLLKHTLTQLDAKVQINDPHSHRLGHTLTQWQYRSQGSN